MPRTQLVHLVYLLNVLWQPVFNPGGGLAAWLIALGIAMAYIPLFVLSHHPDRRVSRRVLVATVVLGALATTVNVGGSVLLVYAAAHASALFGRPAYRWHVGLTALLVVLGLVSPVPFPYRLLGILPSMAFVWIVGMQAMVDRDRDREAERLRIDAVRTEQLATAAERERISGDLHDLLGQHLTSLVVQAQLVQSLTAAEPPRPAEAAAAAADLEATARAALQEVRDTVGGLREVALADEVDLARRTLAAAGLAVEVDVPAVGLPSPLVERSLALALREAVTNVVRHADARTCRIVLVDAVDHWRLEVVDDGIGGADAEGNGLRGMRERITAVGGVVERHTRGGTRLVVTVPA